jgi:peptide/nickel transport system substrate-binding protein
VAARRRPELAAVAAALTALLVTTGHADAGPESLRGGTYRVGWEAGWANPFDWSDAFDPSAEQGDYGIYTNLLVRTLVGYDHVAGVAGTILHADLAVRVPQPSKGGRRYVFTLKRGVRFGPPVDREITAGDIRYAIERLARPRNWPRDTFVYGSLQANRGAAAALPFAIIRGFDAYRDGRTRSISGISTPTRRTVAFTLTRPAADFPHRLALPSAGPIPREVARCFEGRPGAYGRDVVSSGPYMIEGADAVRIDSCAAIRPMRGIADDSLTLVRNPRYDPQTDRAAARESNPDRFVFVVDTATRRGNGSAVARRIATGQLDDAYLRSSPKLLSAAAAAARARGLLRVSPADWLVAVTMNVTQPPFDDVHVRRAMNLVLDRAAMREAGWGGAQAGRIPQHLLPELLLGGRLDGYAPYATPGDHGDLARARAEMARSHYATRNGVCVARACKRVHISHSQLNPAVVYAPSQRVAPLVIAGAAKLGVQVVSGGRRGLRPDVPANEQPLTISYSWYQRYADPADLVDPALMRHGILPRGNVNLSLVGITPAQAAALHVDGHVRTAPRVDGAIARCEALGGTQRLDCFAALDRTLTHDVVPWIPLLWRTRITLLSPQVRRWTFDQSTGMTGYAHVAVRR